MTGSYSASATTMAETKILSFTATPISIPQAELNFIIQDGPDYDNWTISYTTEGVEPKTVTFSGHSVVISDLLSDCSPTEMESIIRLVSDAKKTFHSNKLEPTQYHLIRLPNRYYSATFLFSFCFYKPTVNDLTAGLFLFTRKGIIIDCGTTSIGRDYGRIKRIR